MSEIKQIEKWFQDAKPNPTIKDVCVQIGCDYEEASEMCNTLFDYNPRETLEVSSEYYKECHPHYLGELSEMLKSDEKRIELLDDLCDKIFAATGVGELAGFDMAGALQEVIRSNDSKRLPSGEFLFDENGKVSKKHEHFSEPNLRPFI